VLKRHKAQNLVAIPQDRKQRSKCQVGAFRCSGCQVNVCYAWKRTSRLVEWPLDGSFFKSLKSAFNQLVACEWGGGGGVYNDANIWKPVRNNREDRKKWTWSLGYPNTSMSVCLSITPKNGTVVRLWYPDDEHQQYRPVSKGSKIPGRLPVSQMGVNTQTI